MKSNVLKILLISFIVVVALVCLTGCENKQINNVSENNQNVSNVESKKSLKDIYLEVLDNKRKYVNEQNEEVDINKYLQMFEGKDLVKISYAILDMDNDNEDELVALFESFDGFYLVLNYEDGKVYGFEDVYRGMVDLKTNGYYYGSGGATTGGLLRSTFDKNVRKSETLAETDNGVYKIAGRNVTKQEYDNYIDNEFRNKQGVKWIEYKTVRAPEAKSDFEEGTYEYTVPKNGAENDGAKETLSFENGNITYKDEYFGTTKTATYILNKDNIVIRFTKETLFNQSVDKDETINISESVTYRYSDNKLIISQNGITKTFIKNK